MEYFEKRRRELYGYYTDTYNDDYINDVITESYENDDYDYVEEGLKDMADSIKEKINKAIDKIKELWNKFKNWIKNLFNVVVNMFKSGEKLVRNHQSDIEDAYKKKKNVITFNGYIYRMSGVEHVVKSIESDITNTSNDVDVRGAIMNGAKVGKQLTEKDIASARSGNSKVKDKDSYLKMVSEYVRTPEKKNHKLADVPLNDLIDVAGNGKEVIKNLKKTEKDNDKMYKEAITSIQNLKSEYDSDDKNDAHKIIDSYVKTIKIKASLSSAAIKRLISELKAGVRLYTTLIRKLLDARIKGKDDPYDNETGQKVKQLALPAPKVAEDNNVKDGGAKKYAENQKAKIKGGSRPLTQEEQDYWG